MADWLLAGPFLKSCNCPTLCACDTARTPSQPSCAGIYAMQIEHGHCAEVDLGGLRWAMVLRWPRTLYEGGGQREIYVDSAANAEQRRGIVRILQGEAGGSFFEILRAVTATTYGPIFRPIDFVFDRDRRKARVAAPDCFELTTRPLEATLTGEEQRVILRLPGSWAVKEMDAARTGLLAALGTIQFVWQDTHAALAYAEFSD